MKKDLFFCEAKPISYFSASQKNGTVQRTSVAKRAKRVSFSLSGKSRKGCHSLVFSKKKRCIFFQRKKNVSKKNEHIFKGVRKEWEDYLEIGEDKIDKEKFEIENYDFSNLINCYKEWRIEEKSKISQDSYKIAEELLKEYKIPSLSENYLNEFLEESKINKYEWSGIFFSAIINELYKDGEIHLDSNTVSQLGCYNKNKKIVVNVDCDNYIGRGMEGGKIIVEGDCVDYTGYLMAGGEIVVEGNCEAWIGYHMKGGKIVVEGDCGDWIGTGMKGGKIVVEGDCENTVGCNMKGGEIIVKNSCGYGTGSEMKGGTIKIYGNNFDPRKHISSYAEKGEIYHKDKLVWKDGEYIGDSI